MMEHRTRITVPGGPDFLSSLPFAAGETGLSRHHLLRNDAGKPAPDEKQENQVQSATEKGEGHYILCRLCGNRITLTGEKISVLDAHRHTFANPHGYVFRIGCFRTAPGCRPASKGSTDFSWFAGYAWRIQVCGNCSAHLGWDFRSEEHGFHGLILERIVEEQQDGATE
jgi:hypothetical protein